MTSPSFVRSAFASAVRARSVFSSRILPATLCVGSPVGLLTSAWLNSSAVSGLTTASALPLRSISRATRRICAMPSGVKSSATVWPGFIEMSVSIACPPNRPW